MTLIIDFVFHKSGEFYGQKSFWEIFPPYISALSSLATLILAILIYRNQDAKKSFLKMRIEELLKLVSDMEHYVVIIRMSENGNSYVTANSVSGLESIANQKNLYPILFKDYPLLFNEATHDKLPFFKYRANFLIPKSIRKEIMELIIDELTTVAMESYPNYVYVTSHVEVENESLKNLPSAAMRVEVNSHYDNFESFLKRILNIKHQAIAYLKKYGIDS